MITFAMLSRVFCFQKKKKGRAIRNATFQFGNGETLPYTPCKKGYIPIVHGERKYACSLHNKKRHQRLVQENGIFRVGEVHLNILWERASVKETETERQTSTQNQPNQKKTRTKNVYKGNDE